VASPQGLQLSWWRRVLSGNQEAERTGLIRTLILCWLEVIFATSRFQPLANLLEAQSTFDTRKWLSNALSFSASAFAFALARVATLHSTDQLAIAWRRKLTLKLHEYYFASRAYYHISCGHMESRIEDADVRICKDVQKSCNALAEAVTAALKTLVLSAMGLGAIAAQLNGSLAVVMCPVVIVGVARMSYTSLVVDPTIVLTAFESAAASYQQALTRIQVYGHSICLLQGERFEHSLLQRLLRDVVSWQRALWNTNAPRYFLDRLFFGAQAASIREAVPIITAGYLVARRVERAAGHQAPYDMHTPRQDVSVLFGEYKILEGVMMFGVMACYIPLAAYYRLSAAKGGMHRVQSLFAQLLALQQAVTDATTAAFEDDGPKIAFRNVAIRTPTGALLLKDLSFEVLQGQQLMCCGHNGAGKSSIIRCLGALWPVSAGTIARPGGAKATKEATGGPCEIYYLPQKPCNVLGSLSDQLTYPHRVPGGLPDAELRRWLCYVGLGYLVDKYRAGKTASDTNDWEDLLSVGEQQALNIARLFYHRPRFAVLDECTSAVSRATESELFKIAASLGITCITITHRPALQDYHALMLKLTGDVAKDGRGWELTALAECGLRVGPLVQDATEAHDCIASCIEAGRSAAEPSAAGRSLPEGKPRSPGVGLPTNGVLAARVQERWPTSFRRFLAIVQLGLQEPGRRAAAGRRLAAVAALLLARSPLHWELWTTLGGPGAHALLGDVAGIAPQVLGTLVLLPIVAAIDFSAMQQARSLMAELWEGITSVLHRRVLLSGALPSLLHPEPGGQRLENPLQRIVEVKAVFEQLLGGDVLLPEPLKSVPEIMSTIMLVPSFLYGLPTMLRGGLMGTTTAMVVFLGVFRLCTSLAPDIAGLNVRRNDLESRFQVLHSRLLHKAEAVAFSSGGGAEQSIITQRFDDLCTFMRDALRSQFLFRVLRCLWLDPTNFPLLLTKAVTFSFACSNAPLESSDGVAPLAAVQLHDYDFLCVTMFQPLQNLVGIGPSLWHIDGHFVRILEILIMLDAADAKASHKVPMPRGVTPNEAKREVSIIVRGADLVSPEGSTLARCLDFEIREGMPCMVTGPSGSGKSLLGSMLLGLWSPTGEDAIVAVCGVSSLHRVRVPLALLMPSPQRQYLPSGTLRDQICYPDTYVPSGSAADSRQEKAMLCALEAVGLGHLLVREPAGWDAECVWEDILSGGEQQRLCFARVLYRRPRFAWLDECTSMVSLDAEDCLYKSLVVDYNITPLTASQRLFLPRLHKHELHLGLTDAAGAIGWSLRESMCA